jgi:hypothetical protein
VSLRDANSFKVLNSIAFGSFGDGDFKPLGVTAEPEIKHRIVDGKFQARSAMLLTC